MLRADCILAIVSLSLSLWFSIHFLVCLCLVSGNNSCVHSVPVEICYELYPNRLDFVPLSLFVFLCFSFLCPLSLCFSVHSLPPTLSLSVSLPVSCSLSSKLCPLYSSWDLLWTVPRPDGFGVSGWNCGNRRWVSGSYPQSVPVKNSGSPFWWQVWLCT